MTKKEKKIKGGKHKYIIKTILQFHFEKKECHIHCVAFVYAGVVLGWKPPHLANIGIAFKYMQDCVVFFVTTLQTHPCKENRVFPVYFFSQGKTCIHHLGTL